MTEEDRGPSRLESWVANRNRTRAQARGWESLYQVEFPRGPWFILREAAAYLDQGGTYMMHMCGLLHSIADDWEWRHGHGGWDAEHIGEHPIYRDALALANDIIAQATPFVANPESNQK